MAKNVLRMISLLSAVGLFVGCGAGGGGLNNKIEKERKAYIGAVPFEGPLLYQQHQQMVGPEAELAKRISEKLGEWVNAPGTVEPFWITRTYRTLGSALSNAEIDFIISVYGITEERKNLVQFSEPYYTSDLSLIINPTHNGDLRPNTIKDQKIGVRDGTAGAEKIAAKYPEATIVPYETLDEAILALKRAEVDGVIDDRYMAAFALATAAGVTHLEMVPGPIETVQCAVAVRQGEEEALKLINEVIQEVKAQDQYAKWVTEQIGDKLAEVEQRHLDRINKAQQAKEPRRVVIQVSKDSGSNFDIYRFANLPFVLTELSSGRSYTSTRINFQGQTGVSAVTVPPGNYRVSLTKFNMSPGSVLVRASDPERIDLRIRLQANGSVVMTRG